MKYAPHPRQIVRYRAPTRINHWIVAICFVLTALSGLASVSYTHLTLPTTPYV